MERQASVRAKIKVQIPKIQNFLLIKTFLRIPRAKIPTIKVSIKANKYWELKRPAVDKSLALKTRAPREAGIKRQKEKLKAWVVEKPNKRAAKIVAPARETPGKMAMA